MSNKHDTLRILLISQWPNVKNGEYELIEKIRRTGYIINVVDYLGFDVNSGECLNTATLSREYDFAISFHYDTPKFLNIPTFLWVANPLEFMHLRGDYRSTLFHHLRAYDEYLYNGSETLKHHIRNVVGSDWRDRELEMFPSCSSCELLLPLEFGESVSDTSRKLFYCGVNWERGVDRAGRAQGILDILQDKNVADFFGPNKLEDISPWDGFKSYKGEIPFDGVSMSSVMRQYGAVLAISSPAHMKSATSSSRVFEGIAAGVPVISDENPHVKKLFGDLVYYFRGETEADKATSIIEALRRINENLQDARNRVHQAQALMAQRYCFEPCFVKVYDYLQTSRVSLNTKLAGHRLDVFILYHDPYSDAEEHVVDFANIAHVVEASHYATIRHGVTVRIVVCTSSVEDIAPQKLPPNVEITFLHNVELTDDCWSKLRLGQKVGIHAQKVAGDFASFLTQFDFPNYDAFAKALDWFAEDCRIADGRIFVAGFFVSDLISSAPLGTQSILRNNASEGTYRWTQNSLAEHQLSIQVFDRKALKLLALDHVSRFDVLLPISLIAAAKTRGITVHRSRHMLVRSQFGYFHRHYDSYLAAVAKGFWAQHYELATNYNHELNALCDIHHESVVAMDIVDRVSGFALPPPPVVDPAVRTVNNFISRLRPIYRAYKGFVGWLGKK